MEALVYAFLAPVAWALMTATDKYIISRRVRNKTAYLVPVGLAHLCLGAALALFLSWKGLSTQGVALALGAGVLLALQMFSYFRLLQLEDASELVGFQYLYPLVVAGMSFILLSENLTVMSYVGVIATVVGAILLSERIPDFRSKQVHLIALFVVLVGVTEFVIKVASSRIPEWNGVALNSIAVSCVLIPLWLLPQVRPHVMQELRAFHLTLPTEGLALLAVAAAYTAMAGLSATVVSAIGATEPLIVMGYEGIGSFFGVRLTRHTWRQKLIPVLMIVCGVALVYLEI